MEEAKLKFCLDPRNMDIVRDDSKERISRGRILEVGGNENFTGVLPHRSWPTYAYLERATPLLWG